LIRPEGSFTVQRLTSGHAAAVAARSAVAEGGLRWQQLAAGPLSRGGLAQSVRYARVTGSEVKVGSVIERKGGEDPAHTARPRRCTIQVELRDVQTGLKSNEKLRTSEHIDLVFSDDKPFVFLYVEGEDAFLMEKQTFEADLTAPRHVWRRCSIAPRVVVHLFNGKPLSASLPARVSDFVDEAEPYFKGQTAAPSYKKVKLRSGLTVQVPSFVVAGDEIIVQTSDLTYVTSASNIMQALSAAGCPATQQIRLKPSLLTAKFQSTVKQSPVVRLAVKRRLVAVRAQAAGGESDGGKKQVESFIRVIVRCRTAAAAHGGVRAGGGPHAGEARSRRAHALLALQGECVSAHHSQAPDGYHELASLFHAISLGDTLKFSFSPSNSRDALTTNAPGVPLDSSNLVIKALDLFRRKTGIQKYFWVHLDKKVPTGAGLGGGSGNAATALWAANRMCGDVASEAELLEWSADIGSDISFFFSQGAAYCTGRGR
ncbi:hypothetical protein CLOM_g21795, partial [Closterium sp. NIES-68]